MRKLALFEASATLIGTVIGAGILGIPFAIAQVGFPLGVAIMIFLSVAMLVRHLMLAEVTLRTKEIHQMPGYVGLYLSKWAKQISFLAVILGGFGSLLAYIIGEGEVLAAIFGGSSLVWSLLFYLIAVLFILVGLSLIKRSELVMSGLILLITLAVGFFAWGGVNLDNLMFWQPGNWILPYGVLLFAYTGTVAVPQMREELVGRERILFRSIILASLVILVVYLVFSFLVLGVTGVETSQLATVSLGKKIGPEMVLIGNLLAFFTMGTSFLTIGLAIKEMFQFDYGWGALKSWATATLIPLILFLAGARDFIQIIGLVGGILIGLQSIFIILTFYQARKHGKRKPEFSLGPMRIVGAILILLFVLGAVFTLINI